MYAKYFFLLAMLVCLYTASVVNAEEIMIQLKEYDHGVGNLPSPPPVVDDGCYDPPANCLVTDSPRFSYPPEGKKFAVTFTNVCNKRLLISMCNEYSRNYKLAFECGSTGLMPGHSYRWSTGSGTGRYYGDYIGATLPNYDFVCAGKIKKQVLPVKWN